MERGYDFGRAAVGVDGVDPNPRTRDKDRSRRAIPWRCERILDGDLLRRQLSLSVKFCGLGKARIVYDS